MERRKEKSDNFILPRFLESIARLDSSYERQSGAYLNIPQTMQHMVKSVRTCLMNGDIYDIM